ncbi:MAG: hypothetical protein JXA09_10385 [Anaerolineae bacterium]|nr:hypothetical protein [Anaerolineae bacterium]
MLSETMTKQTRQAFHTLRTAIESCPDTLWRGDGGPYLVVARLAFHALQAIDYHLDPDPNGFDWDAQELDWEGSDVDALWDRAQTLRYLDQMRAKALAYCADEGGLLAPDVQPRTFLSRLDHLCYALRHLAQHTGEINALLRQAGAPVGRWL